MTWISSALSFSGCAHLGNAQGERSSGLLVGLPDGLELVGGVVKDCAPGEKRKVSRKPPVKL